METVDTTIIRGQDGEILTVKVVENALTAHSVAHVVTDSTGAVLQRGPIPPPPGSITIALAKNNPPWRLLIEYVFTGGIGGVYKTTITGSLAGDPFENVTPQPPGQIRVPIPYTVLIK
jgi:hypothetical protein